MKSSAPPVNLSAQLRRDLIPLLAYVNRTARSSRSVDRSFGRPEIHLDQLAAAARMQ